MRQARQAELLDRLVGIDTTRPWSNAPASLRNPATAYTDPVRFAREVEVLFKGQPQFVGLTDDCRNPGDYLTTRLGGVPILLIRQPDHSLRALVNICRHRAAPVMAGAGQCAEGRLVCPYHGWTYGVDGRLLGKPGAWHGFDDVDTSLDLHPRAVAEHHGLIFVHPASTTPFHVDDVLCGAEQELADFGLADYVHVETRNTEWRMNWKLILDTFTESYHIRFLHKDSIAPYFMADTLFDAFGPNPRAIGLRKDVVDQLTTTPRDAWKLLPYSTAQYFLVPNGLLVYQIDHVEVWRIEPLAVNQVRVSTSLYAPTTPTTDKARNYWKKNLDVLLGVTGREDFPMMEEIQANLASGALPELVYGRIEPALVHLHASINAALNDTVIGGAS
jgi:phenylpropionate dioxygenase-like ring-hydroxylating dioxygenase large terminal subunit